MRSLAQQRIKTEAPAPVLPCFSKIVNTNIMLGFDEDSMFQIMLALKRFTVNITKKIFCISVMLKYELSFTF